MANLFFESGKGKQVYQMDQQLYQAGLFLGAMHIRNGKMVFFEKEERSGQQKTEERQPDLVWDLKKNKLD